MHIKHKKFYYLYTKPGEFSSRAGAQAPCAGARILCAGAQALRAIRDAIGRVSSRDH